MYKHTLALVAVALVAAVAVVPTTARARTMSPHLRTVLQDDLARLQHDLDQANFGPDWDEYTNSPRKNADRELFLGVTGCPGAPKKKKKVDPCLQFKEGLVKAGHWKPGRENYWKVPVNRKTMSAFWNKDDHLKQSLVDYVIGVTAPLPPGASSVPNNPYTSALNAEKYVQDHCASQWAVCKKKFLTGSLAKEFVWVLRGKSGTADQAWVHWFKHVGKAAGLCDNIALKKHKGNRKLSAKQKFDAWLKKNGNDEHERRCLNKLNRAVMRMVGTMRSIAVCRIRLDVWMSHPTKFPKDVGPKLEGAGSTDPTSDIDVNLKGPGTEDVVRMGNEASIKHNHGMAMGALYDVNLYALDYMPKAYNGMDSFPAQPYSSKSFRRKDWANNDVLAFMKAFQHDDNSEYAQVKALVIKQLQARMKADGAGSSTISKVAKSVAKRFDLGQTCGKLYNRLLLAQFAKSNQATKEVKALLKKTGASVHSVLHHVEHHAFKTKPKANVPLDSFIHAANHLYEKILADRKLTVKQLANAHSLARDKLQLRRELMTGWATVFSNEPMNSRGAVMAVVGGTQICTPWRYKTPLNINLQSLIENYGDVFKELVERKADGSHKKATIKTIIKAAKYLVRAGDAWWHLQSRHGVTATKATGSGGENTICSGANWKSVRTSDPLDKKAGTEGQREFQCDEDQECDKMKPQNLDSTKSCLTMLVSRKFFDLLLIKKRREPYGGSEPKKLESYETTAATIVKDLFGLKHPADLPKRFRFWWANAVADSFAKLYSDGDIEDPTIPDDCNIDRALDHLKTLWKPLK
eukprot:TRINITY_DN1097_c0_g1_i1.p1 TRINITY_DN1097_c0_g1~~TRINITY_DN1097_c0_g1_i1.p1  ORF type:complete len:804 (-),score=236.97 TRINITY_DN1097_c0_g1_i1:96-2507(-)